MPRNDDRLNRRKFLQTAGLLAAVPFAARAAEPISRPGTPHMKLSLAAYIFQPFATATPQCRVPRERQGEDAS